MYCREDCSCFGLSQVNGKAGPWLNLFLCLSLFVSTASAATAVNGRLVFGGDAVYPPFEWKEGGRSVGFNIDLARTLTESEGVETNYQLGQWSSTIAALQQGDIDVVAMFVSDVRDKEFLFTSPFHYVTHVAYAREGATAVYDLSGLSGEFVAIENQSYAQQQFEEVQSGASLVLTAGTLDALRAVVEGKAAYAVLAAPTADNLIEAYGLPLQRKSPPFWPRGYAFAVRRDRPELRNWLQENLEAVIANGGYLAVYHKWEDELHPQKQDSGARTIVVAWVITALLAVVALVAVFSWSLQRKVRARTSDLNLARQRAEQAESHALYLADYEPTTHLPRQHLFQALADEFLTKVRRSKRQKPEVMLFKLVDMNELISTFGNAVVEDFVREFAKQLRSRVMGCHSYFGRGVFAACSDAEAFAQFVRFIESQDSDRNNYPNIVMGSATFSEAGETSAELISHAELALAIAQSEQQRLVAYHPAMEPDPLDLEIVSVFRANRLDGLYAVFQPQVDLRTNAVIGAEALVRWEHPVHGNIAPAKFIPLVEKAGAIAGITALMVNEAARVGSRLRSMGCPVPISVNVAVQDLLCANLPDVIAEALERHGGRPGDIKIELTETSFTDDLHRIKQRLEQLDRMGVNISIDDFGTGYSTLAYLSILPITELKIDRTFVHDIASNGTNHAIVRSTILMAKELRLKTMAEGAENMATVDLLAADGCDGVQGFAISRPLSETQFLQFLEEQRRLRAAKILLSRINSDN